MRPVLWNASLCLRLERLPFRCLLGWVRFQRHVESWRRCFGGLRGLRGLPFFPSQGAGSPIRVR